jgi:hypothetical protein
VRFAGQPTLGLIAASTLTAAGLLAMTVTAPRSHAAATAVPNFRHALVVVFENKEQGAIVGQPRPPSP